MNIVVDTCVLVNASVPVVFEWSLRVVVYLWPQRHPPTKILEESPAHRLEDSATEPGLPYFLRPPRSHQTGLASHFRILSGFVRGFSLTRRQERRGAALAEAQTADPSFGLGGLRSCGVATKPWPLPEAEARTGAVRRSRGGRGVPGQGRPAGVCAPRACRPAGRRAVPPPTRRLFTNKLPALGSDAFRRAE